MRNNLKKFGIYTIRNIVNGKMYVGSTTTSFNKRWIVHKRRLKNNTHHSKHLQSAYNKYGKNNFVYEIIEIVSDASKVLEREGFYIELYKTNNPKYGYNIEVITEFGVRKCSEETKKKLSIITKKQWEDGVHDKSRNIGKPSWNKGLKCNNISIARRNMFKSIEVYKDNTLIAIFRSVTDLDEWSKTHELPGIIYYKDSNNRANKGKRTTHILSANIHRAVRNNAIFRGFTFKKTLPLSPEKGVVQWVNCWKPEMVISSQAEDASSEGSETT